MAGEKTTKRTTSRPTQKETEYITMTSEQLKSFVSEAVKAGVGSSQQVPQSAKPQVEENIQSSLTKRINDRNKKGDRFNAELSDPNGPRKRIKIDKIYREFTGAEITATVNGNTVKVPADGKYHYVHPAHYMAIQMKLNYLSNTRDRAVEGPGDMFGDEVGDFQKIER